MMECVTVLLIACVQEALAATAAAAAAEVTAGLGVLPVASRERTSMARCGQALSTRLAAVSTSSMVEEAVWHGW
jgi:hypothetical protein